MSKRIRPSWWWLLGLVVVAGAFWFAFNLRAAPRIPPTVGPATTRLVAPLAEDGFPDYGAAIDGLGGSPPPAEENAAAALVEALGVATFVLDPELRPAVLERLGLPASSGSTTPFVAPHERAGKDDPEGFLPAVQRAVETPGPITPEAPVIAWLEAQDAALDAARAALARPRLWLPSLPGRHGEGALQFLGHGAVGPLLDLGRGLALRARVRVAKGTLDAATDDLIATWRAAALTTGLPGSMSWIGADFLARAALRVEEDLLAAPGREPATEQRLLAALASLPEGLPLRRQADEGDRYALLDLALRMTGVRPFPDAADWAAARESHYDGDLMLGEINRIFDEAVGLLGTPQPVRARRLEQYVRARQEELQAEMARYRSVTGYLAALFDSPEAKRRVASLGVARFLVLPMIGGLAEAAGSTDGFLARRRLARLGIALAAVRREAGAWPQDLAALPLEAAERTDPFSGEPFRVRRFEGGVVVFGLGPDRASDDGRQGSDDPALRLRDPR